MIEFQVVEVPTLFPMMCSCGNQRGPLIDTHRERNGVHEYVCLTCAKEFARIFGFLPGDKLNELAEAAAAVARLEYDLAERERQLREERETIELLERSLEQRIAELDVANGRITHLEKLRRTVAEELVA